MIPALNMTKIHRNTPASGANNGGVAGSAGLLGQGSISRLHTSRQMSPRTPNVTSPRDATSSLPSAHFTRRAAEVAPVLEMNPLQCHNIEELQRKLVETAEWVIKLRCVYALQLQERDQWLDSRLRDLEKFYTDAVKAIKEGRVEAAAAPATTTNTGNTAAAVSATSSSSADNGAPATIPTGKVAVAGVPLSTVSEIRMADSEKDGVTPPRRRRGKQQTTATSVLSSVVNSPQPSLPNNALVDGGSIDAADSNSSAGRLRTSQPKKSTVVRITQGRRTISASGTRRHPPRAEDSASPLLDTAATAQSAVVRGESRPTRAARGTAERDALANSVDTGATRRRCPPALSASRDTTATYVGGTDGPRLDVLAATVPATTRPGKSALSSDLIAPTYLSASTGGEVERRRSGSTSSHRRCDVAPSPRAAPTDLSASTPPSSQYLEAGFGLHRDHTSNNASATRDNTHNGPNTSVGSATEPPQRRTPRDGSSYFYLLGNSGRQPGRMYSTSGSARVSQRSTSLGVSSRAKRKGTNSGTVSAQSSPARAHPVR